MEFKKNKLLLFRLLIFLLVTAIIFQVVEILKDRHLKESCHNYNIILIDIDSLRADHLGCYGYSKDTSPNIDKLAEKSIIFKENYTPIPYTLASFASLMTSLYPKSHGVFFIFKDKYPSKIKTLTEILKLSGYKTGWFGPLDPPHLNPKIGVGRGYDDISEFPLDLDKAKMAISDWLEKNKNSKFFLALHTYHIHYPYFSSPEYRERFTREKTNGIIENNADLMKAMYSRIKKDLSRKEGLSWDIFGESLSNDIIAEGFLEETFGDNRMEKLLAFLREKRAEERYDSLKTTIYFDSINLKDENDRKHLLALYDAAILEFDMEIIGPIIQKLKELEIYDKTIIIIFGDHGEEFGEHGGRGHGGTLYNELTHIPLIIRIPWIIRGKQIREMTQIIDVMPTLLDLLDIPVPDYVQGKSLVGFITGRKISPLYQYVFGQREYKSSIKNKKWKLILYHDGRKELFYLKIDPGEKNNLYQKREDVALKLERELKKWEESLPSYQDEDYPFAPEVDEAARERIKKTGYW